jgi:hypothetical protein
MPSRLCGCEGGVGVHASVPTGVEHAGLDHSVHLSFTGPSAARETWPIVTRALFLGSQFWPPDSSAFLALGLSTKPDNGTTRDSCTMNTVLWPRQESARCNLWATGHFLVSWDAFVPFPVSDYR